MNTGTLVPAEENARHDGAPEIPGRDPIPTAGSLERWLLHHLNAVALAVVAAGFALRMFVANRTYLNPDEALHYLLLNQSSVFLAYKASLTNAHPPLIYLVLYYWRFLGRSELMLRLPSVIAGTAFCWVAFKWMGNVFGKAAGLIGLILIAFSPAMVALSAEVRAYALLLFCMGGALYFLERAFAEKSVREMWCFTAFLYLSILSHYSAVFFAAAMGVYTLARIADSHLPRRAVIAWAAGQAGALAIYGILYVTHVSKIKNSIEVWSRPFDSSYFHTDAISLFTFTWENTLNIFLFLFGQRLVAHTMLLCFVAGVAFLFARDLLSRRENSQSSRLGILLFFPFIAVWGASLAGIYPYVGSRHTVFLAPFVIAGASYLLSAVSGQRLWAGLLIAILAMALSSTADKPVEPDVSSADHTPAAMATTVSYMERTIPRGDHILVDFQSSLPMTYYFCGPKEIIPVTTFLGSYFEFSCNGYSIVSLHVWKLIPQSFRLQFEKMARSHDLKPGDRVWVYQTGWGVDLGTELASHDAAFRCLAPKSFGGGVTVTPFIVGPDFSPVSPRGAC
jgi:Dolichyl-phosphate-mannose-protein mannosyltransferase